MLLCNSFQSDSYILQLRDKMPAMKCFLKWSEEPIIVTLPVRRIIFLSIMSFLCHTGTPRRGCVHTAYTDFLLSCLVNYSSISCPYHTDTRLLSPRLQSSSPDFWLRSPQYQIDKRSRSYFRKRHKSIKSTQIVEEQESIAILFLQHWGCVMWCDVVCCTVHQPSTHTLQI